MALHATTASDVSVGDDPTTRERRGKIRQWISDIDSIDHVASRSSVAGTELSSSASSEDPRPNRFIDGTTYKGSDSTLSKLEPDNLLPDDDLDGEDDFFVEAAQQALETGSTAFRLADYQNSAAYLREALTMIKGLTVKQQTLCDTWELRRMLSICVFHVYDPVDAEAALLSVLDNAPKNAILSEEQRLQISEIAHLLGQTYVKLGDLNKAYRYCEYALRGRRRVLGKSHEYSYESLALMARVLELQGNRLRAQFFTDMIPEGERQTYVPRFESLRPSGLPIGADQPAAGDEAAPLEQSLKIALQEVSSAEIARPTSSRSRAVSALSGANSIIAGNTGDAVSPPTSPDLRIPDRSARRPVVSSEIETSPSRSQDHDQSLLNASHQQGNVRPSHSRSVSDLPIPGVPEVKVLPPPSILLNAEGARLPASEAVQMPLFNPPCAPNTVYPEHTPVRFIHETYPTSQQATVLGDSTRAHNRAKPGSDLYPQPLALQRPFYASELPGDTHFSIALGAPPTAPLPSPPARRQYERPMPPPAPQSPPRYQVSNPPVAAHPADRHSISSGQRLSIHTRREDSTSDVSSHEIQPDIVFVRRNTDQREPRKPSLLSMFRSKSSANEAQLRATSTQSGAIRLARSDLVIIKHEPITDTIIDFWQEHLERVMIKGNSKYVLMRPVRCYFLIHEKEITPSLKATLPDFRNTVHVLIPLKSSSGHWSLLLVSAQDMMACHYDPYTGKNQALAESVSRRISSILDSPLTFLEVAEIPEQADPKDSGVFVCFFMQYLIEKLQRTHVSQKTDASLDCKAIRGKDGRKEILKIAKVAGGLKE